ncbi:snoRNA-binding rRNA-processing protein utp10 [Candidozyma auris]
MGESANESAYDGDNEDVVIENNAVNSSSEAIKSKETYFLSTAANFDFFKIVDALLRELKEIPQNKQVSYFLKASKRAFLNDVAHVSFLIRVWRIIGSQNKKTKGFDDRFYFVTDAKDLLLRRNPWIHDASAEGLNAIDDIMKPVASMVGGLTTNEKKRAKEIDWFVRALSTEDQLQVVANERVQEIFPLLKVTELKVGLCKEFIELLIKETDSVLHFDPLDTLQGLEILNEDMVALLNSVNIVTEVPEQSVPKRRRRSSSSTQKNMARDDINTMAAAHLRKLSVILDVSETQLRKSQSLIADSDLLQVLFKILTDLDYLGNDGKLPILYAQETLASCMQLCVVKIKESQAKHRIDSNSIRADLIVNSIRLSQSPQVQNRLLLVIAELASLAPEIILHSVMPIFTFMGAHTVRQDDEFSSSALQQTISKVVPAITAASSSISTEIDFLLTAQ